MTQVATFACERCGQPIPQGALVCPYCGALPYRAQLEQLASDAMRLESTDPAGAIGYWQRALGLLPPDSQQYHSIYDRIGALAGGNALGGNGSPRMRARETWLTAVAKTGGSMLLSILIYTFMFKGETLALRFGFSFGFVVLILIHELGHVVAMRHYDLSASPPIFIPFVGALINLRQHPPNAKVEAIVGIGGPIAGTIAALACFAMFLFLPAGPEYKVLLLRLSFFGFLLNLFNLIPLPPLDGGRVTAAISPWMWLVGLALFGLMLVSDFLQSHSVNWILVLVLFFALPRVMQTLRGRSRRSEYYSISKRSSWAIAIAYFLLAAVLAALFIFTRLQLRKIGADLF